MSQADRTAEFSPACPDAETLANFGTDALTEPMKSRVAEHVSGCPVCRTAMDASGGESWDAPVPPPAHDVFAPTTAPEGPASSRGASRPPSPHDLLLEPGAVRYELQSLHAEGGLGEVFLARDRELERDVAVKRIRARLSDDPATQSRFVREARLTGGLEHPAIVPVYGLQRQADGRPLYSMRFVRGESLHHLASRFHQRRREGMASIARDDREFRQLIGHCAAVCQAVAYAHSRGVIHRDIKPDNILCGQFGETLLVDWGLAKRTNGEDGFADSAPAAPVDDPSATSLGVIVGTPAYMSPEQAQGESASAGPASDIYSLGATLYHLLAGKPPHTGANPLEICESARSGSFPSPRDVEPTVPRPLEAICRRALSLNPSDRHASAKELASELECWLADDPIPSYPEPRRKRLVRWLRKHPRLTTGAGVAIVLGVSALTVSLAIFGRLNRELADSNRKLNDANLKLAASRALAEERADLALRSFELIVYQVQRRLRDVPGTLDARREILATALTSLRQLRLSGGLKPRGDTSTAFALMDMGDLVLQHRLSPTGGLDGEGTGQDAGKPEHPALLALEAYQQAAELQQSRLAESPDSAGDQFALAIAIEKKADAYWALGRADEARQGYEKCIEMMRPVAERLGPERFEYLGPVGPMLKLANYFPNGVNRLAIGQECARYSQARFAAAPQDEFAERYLGIALIQIGHASTDPAESARSFELAESVLRNRYLRLPNNAETQRDLADVLLQRAEIALREGRIEAAGQAASEASQLALGLASRDAASSWHRDYLIRASALWKRLPRDSNFSGDSLIALLREAGLAELQSGQVDRACESFALAESVARRALEKEMTPSSQAALIDSLLFSGDALRQKSDDATAYQKYLEAERRLEELPADDNDAMDRRRRYNAAWRIAEVLARRRDWEPAWKKYETSTELAEREYRDEPNEQTRADLLWVLERHAEAAVQRGEPATARNRWTRALEVLRPEVVNPASPEGSRAKAIEERLRQIRE
ncbi:MAG: serine/threonine-protein kinase [Pirellulales bacterium]